MRTHFDRTAVAGHGRNKLIKELKKSGDSEEQRNNVFLKLLAECIDFGVGYQQKANHRSNSRDDYRKAYFSHS